MASRRTVPGLAGGIAGADDNIPDGLKPGGELDRYVKKLAAEDEFCGSFLVTHKRRKVLGRSYGMADIKGRVPNKANTRFKLASVTKMFTATAIHQLAQKGKVEYGRPIGAYIDGFSGEVADKVTIHHLLLHTSGLGGIHSLPGYAEASREWDSAAEVMEGTLDFIREVELDFAPGSDSQYSNAGYCVLGGIIAAVSKQSYFDFVRDNVFKPAKMRDSDFYTKPEWQRNPKIAHPYLEDEKTGGWIDELDQHPYIGLPAGHSFATCGDMSRFVNALLDGELLSRQFARIMLGAKLPMGGGDRGRPADGSSGPARVEFAGYDGTASNLLGDQRLHGFSGGRFPDGPSTAIDIYPDSDWVLVVLSNRDPALVRDVARIAQGHILGTK